MKSWLQRVCASLLVAVSAFASGCTPLDLRKSIEWPFSSDEEDYVDPAQLVAVWTDIVLTRSDGPAIRGFGGRVMFYDKSGKEPIKAKGTLVVYAYDDSKHQKSQMEPDRKFVFRVEEFEKHYSESRIGHSYSFWLPWGPVGGMQKEITLIARFKATGGNEVVGEPANVPLPGAMRDSAEENKRGEPGLSDRRVPEGQVRWASHQTPVPASNVGSGDARQPNRRMVTTTIRVPPAGSLRTAVSGVQPSTEPEPRPPAAAGTHPSAAAAYQQYSPVDQVNSRVPQLAYPTVSSAPPGKPAVAPAVQTPCVGLPPVTQHNLRRMPNSVPPWPAEAPRQDLALPPGPTRYSPPRPPVQGGSFARPGFAPSRWQPPRGAWQYRCGPTPPAASPY